MDRTVYAGYNMGSQGLAGLKGAGVGSACFADHLPDGAIAGSENSFGGTSAWSQERIVRSEKASAERRESQTRDDEIFLGYERGKPENFVDGVLVRGQSREAV